MPLQTPTIAIEDAPEDTGSSPVSRPKVGFVSLGCPKNLVDSEVMMGMLAQAGADLISRAEDADVIVVNTCSFIASAQQESVNTILEMARQRPMAAPRNWWSQDAWSNASATTFARIFQKLTLS